MKIAFVNMVIEKHQINIVRVLNYPEITMSWSVVNVMVGVLLVRVMVLKFQEVSRIRIRPLHNVLFVQYLFLSTERGRT